MVCADVKSIVIPLPIVSDPRQLNEGLLRAWQVPVIRSFYSFCNTALRTQCLSLTYSRTDTNSTIRKKCCFWFYNIQPHKDSTFKYPTSNITNLILVDFDIDLAIYPSRTVVTVV